MSGEGEEGMMMMMMAKNKVKFLCSHSGKILPRPPDGQLKYVGGETRVVAVPRAIDFSGLMEKLMSGVCEGDMVLKYQLIPDEFDILVSVRSNEDLQHMFAEYDRQECTNTNATITESSPPRLRTFLFPSRPVVVLERQPSASSSSDSSTEAEQRYIEAINGILRCSTNAKRGSLNAGSRSIFSVSSACSSSPTDHHDNVNDTNVINNNLDALAFGSHSSGRTSTRAGYGFQRVCSSPTLYNLSQHSQQQMHLVAPPLHQQQQQHHHHHHHHQHQYSHQPSFSRLQRSSSANGPGRLLSQLSIGGSSSNLPPPVHYYHPSSLKQQQQLQQQQQQQQHLKGCGGCSSCGGPADGNAVPGYQVMPPLESIHLHQHPL